MRGKAWQRYQGGCAMPDESEFVIVFAGNIGEADIRIALAWAYKATNNHSSARAEADRAHRMSEDTGYHWGKVDAEEVLAELD